MNPHTLIITGGKPLEGTITVRGAKNSIPKLMVASLLTDQPCTLTNVADIEDVDVVQKMVETLGGTVQRENGTLHLHTPSITPTDLRTLHHIADKSRIPILFAGPLLARTGEAKLPRLGGCTIGARPVDFHITALKQLGAEGEEAEDGFRLRAKRLHGTHIHLDYPSVGTTEQILLSSVLAEGVTELTNAAIEPEIMDLVLVLQKMGAIIHILPNRTYRITGVSKLNGFAHHVIPDRIEVASWACAAATTNGKITVENARQEDLITFLNTFRTAGGEFSVTETGITFWRENSLKPVAIETDVHPGFMTDWQQPFTVLLTQAEGASIVHETVFENRFGYVAALNRMGARIQLFRDCLGPTQCRFGQRNHLHSAVIIGKTPLKGATVAIPNVLRAGVSYVVAALTAEGTSTLTNFGIIHRGYEHFTDKLRSLGANVKLVE